MRFQASDGLRGGSRRPIAYYTGEKFMLACLQMKPYAVLLLACLIAGCANVGLRENRAFELQDGDFGLIAGAALEIVERLGPVRTIVVPAIVALVGERSWWPFRSPALEPAPSVEEPAPAS